MTVCVIFWNKFIYICYITCFGRLVSKYCFKFRLNNEPIFLMGILLEWTLTQKWRFLVDGNFQRCRQNIVYCGTMLGFAQLSFVVNIDWWGKGTAETMHVWGRRVFSIWAWTYSQWNDSTIVVAVALWQLSEIQLLEIFVPNWLFKSWRKTDANNCKSIESKQS